MKDIKIQSLKIKLIGRVKEQVNTTEEKELVNCIIDLKKLPKMRERKRERERKSKRQQENEYARDVKRHRVKED